VQISTWLGTSPKKLISESAWWVENERDREVYLNLVYDKAREEMEKHWPWVPAVAEKLIERKTLSGEEVLRLKPHQHDW